MATNATSTLPPKPKLSHRAVANAQVGLSYFIFTGFFIFLALQGLGRIKIDVVGDFKEILSLIVYFWFQRSRDSTSEAPAAGTLSGIQVPPSPTPGASAHVQPVPASPVPSAVLPAKSSNAPPSAPSVGGRPTTI